MGLLKGYVTSRAGLRLVRTTVFLDRREIQAHFLLLVHPVWFCVHEALHCVLSYWPSTGITVSKFIFTSETAHARPSTSTAARPFIMSRQSISTSESTTAFEAYVRSLAGM